MMDKEFLEIEKDIIYTPEFQKLKYEKHHGITRYEHSIRVAKSTYLMTKKMGLDYKKATRAALLHDLFYASDITTKWLKISYEHPIRAYQNASKICQLSDKEINIIKCHMFPLSRELPMTKEAWIVSIADKKIATIECMKYKFNIKNLIAKKKLLLANKN